MLSQASQWTMSISLGFSYEVKTELHDWSSLIFCVRECHEPDRVWRSCSVILEENTNMITEYYSNESSVRPRLFRALLRALMSIILEGGRVC